MSTVVAIAAGLALSYLLLVAALLIARPEKAALSDALRLLPDLLRLVRRLAADRALPRGVRIRLWLLLAYLAMPFDLIPDFIPSSATPTTRSSSRSSLRSVMRRAGPDGLERHWPGTPDGLRAIHRITGTVGAT